MKNIKILWITICSILLSQNVMAQTYYYSSGTTFNNVNGSTSTYICSEYIPGADVLVILHNKNNTLTFTKQKKTDGSPRKVEGIKNYYTVPPAKYSTIHNTITSYLTSEEKQRIKNCECSMLVSLYINSSTGAVTEVNFFFLTNEVFATIPPAKYFQIENALKRDFSVNMLSEGKKLNYNLYTYTYSYVPGWVPGW